jgi:hypothetical protein
MMTPTEIFLAIIAAEMGFTVLFLVVFVCMEIGNSNYVRKCFAEAQLKQAEAATNPLTNLIMSVQQAGGADPRLAGAIAAAQSGEAPVPCTEEKCDGTCDGCKAKAEGGGNYL